MNYRIILCMRPASERPRYIVKSSLIGSAYTEHDLELIRCNYSPDLKYIFL